MNKILSYLKNILLLLLFFLHIKFISIHGLISFRFVFYLLLFGIVIFIQLKDIVNHESINHNKFYNILFIFIESLMIFIFLRSLYDMNFPYNCLEIETLSILEEAKSISMLYLYQNIIYFIVLLVLLMTYRKLNKENKNPKPSKYNMISVTCFLTSILMIPFVISSIGTNMIYFYLFLNILLVIIEIYRLLKDNYQKKEWIIYLSFLSNLISFILMIASLI